MAGFDSYIICGSPRTGSTLLCEMLASTGAAGAPDSFFMRDVDPVWAAQWDLPETDGLGTVAYAVSYLEAAIRAGRGQTEIFGLRLMRENLSDVMSMIGLVHPGMPSDKDGLRAAFGRVLYIHLSRRDKLSQAVSMVKAEQSGLWHIAPDGSELERLSPHRDPVYDFARIESKVAALEQYDAAWLAWFSAQGIEPLTIAYEDLSDRPEAVVLSICRKLGVRLEPQTKLVPSVAKLADAVSRDWIARYQAEVATYGTGGAHSSRIRDRD